MNADQPVRPVQGWPNGATSFAGVIGGSVRRSLSPVLHNAAFAALGLNWAYGAFSVAPADLAATLAGVQALGFVGLSVTTPHKDAVAALCDQASETVTRLAAANTVEFKGGVAIARNTDGEGLVDDLREAESFSPTGQCCAVIGAGGAARAVIDALAEAGAAEVLVVNRTPERATRAATLARGHGRVAVAEELASAALVVNATSIGLHPPTSNGDSDPGRLLARHLVADQLVVDLVYHPAMTPFLTEAAARGARIRNGLGMLVCQAARQIEIWTAMPAPRAAMWGAVRDFADGGAPGAQSGAPDAQ